MLRSTNNLRACRAGEYRATAGAALWLRGGTIAPMRTAVVSSTKAGRQFSWLGVAALLACSFACVKPASHGRADQPAGSTLGASSAARAIAAFDATSHWKGYVEMVPPIRLPTNLEATERIAVFLSIPAGQTIEVAYLEDQKRHTLRFPPGTIADRLDGDHQPLPEGRYKWTYIDDVRGTRIATGKEQFFHVYAPLDFARPTSQMTGWEWERGHDAQRIDATERLVAWRRALEHTRCAGFIAAPCRKKANRDLRLFRYLNDCAACHRPNLPEVDRQPIASYRAARATDASGFYVPLSVLDNSGVVPRHRPRDRNVGDRFIEARCGESPARLERDPTGRTRYACPDGRLPRATKNIEAALAAGDLHAMAVCRSRKYLFDHMDAAGKMAFAAAFSACEL